jgi:hypothetical protein
MKTEIEILDREDFINEMLNQSDYETGEIIEFANEHLQNLLSLEENINLFIIWIEN